MPRVLVIGSVNHDRIWRLDAPLVPGRRLLVRERKVVLGGGGFHTGRALLDLGAEVALVSRLRRDEFGLSALKALGEIGFDTGHVELLAGETEPLDILLDPDGERTILMPLRSGREPLRIVSPIVVDAAYLNALGLDGSLLASLARISLVISQLPLRPATPRPADYVVTSRNDSGDDPASIWARAAALAGERLKAVVITDGPHPVMLHDGVHLATVDTVPASHVGSSIGAGDRFCGALLLALLEGALLAQAVATASRRTADWLARQAPPR